MKKIEGTIKSAKGFYVDDICHVLTEDIYYGFWGGECGYRDGIFEEPTSGYSFAVAGTAYGDGEYIDSTGRIYGIDAGNIGLVPAELIANGIGDGHYFECPGEAYFNENDGVFCIILPDNRTVRIDTN